MEIFQFSDESGDPFLLGQTVSTATMLELNFFFLNLFSYIRLYFILDNVLNL